MERELPIKMWISICSNFSKEIIKKAASNIEAAFLVLFRYFNYHLINFLSLYIQVRVPIFDYGILQIQGITTTA